MPKPDPPGDATSATLIDLIRANDQDAWARTVYLYRPLVLFWCRRRGVRPEDAEDVAQEVFRAVTSGIAGFRRDRQGGTFRGWLLGVTRNKVVDWHRKKGREPAEAAGGTEAGLRLGGLPDESEGDDDDPRELSELYRRALELVRDEFEANTWRSFWRVAVDGEAVADVAASMGVSTAAIRQSKSRVLRRLRQEIGDLID